MSVRGTSSKDFERLLKPEEFRRRHPRIFASRSAMHYHLAKRLENGLAACGGAVDTRLGVRLDEERVLEWLATPARSKRADRDSESETETTAA